MCFSIIIDYYLILGLSVSKLIDPLANSAIILSNKDSCPYIYRFFDILDNPVDGKSVISAKAHKSSLLIDCNNENLA